MFLRITSGMLGGRRISVPDSNLRPTEEKVRAALFNSLFSMIDFDGKVFLDLCAGSGAVGIEALSRGFSFSTFIEKNKKTCTSIIKNLADLDLSNESHVLCGDGFETKTQSMVHQKCDVVFIDPPYENSIQIPEAINLLIGNSILSDNPVIVVETGGSFDFIPAQFSVKHRQYGKTVLSYFVKT